MYNALRQWLYNYVAQYLADAFAERDTRISTLEDRVSKVEECLKVIEDKLGVTC